jgi:hypothetical protein
MLPICLKIDAAAWLEEKSPEAVKWTESGACVVRPGGDVDAGGVRFTESGGAPNEAAITLASTAHTTTDFHRLNVGFPSGR